MKALLLILLISFAAPTVSVFAQSSPIITPNPAQEQRIEAAGKTLSTGTGMERKRAESYLTTAYIKGDHEAKNAVASLIVSLLNEPVKEGELWNDDSSLRAKACVIAGHAEIEAAIPALIKLLKPLPGQRVAQNLENLPDENEDGHVLGFAARALVDIGKPAVSALTVEQQQTADPAIRSIIKSVLSDIDKEEPYKEQKRRLYR